MKDRDIPEYGVWQGMKQRCYNPNTTSFHLYGGAGVRICEKWRTSFETFFNDMGPRPSSFHQIHRKNRDGDYCPENCIWIDKHQHAKLKNRPKVNQSLTDRQRKVFDYIAEHDGRVTIREIAAFFSISVKGAYDHVKAIEHKGAITMHPGIARSIRIIEVPGEK